MFASSSFFPVLFSKGKFLRVFICIQNCSVLKFVPGRDGALCTAEPCAAVDENALPCLQIPVSPGGGVSDSSRVSREVLHQSVGQCPLL